MEAVLKEILAKLDTLGQGQQDVLQRQKSLEQTQQSILQRLDSLEQGQQDLLQRQERLEQGQQDLKTMVSAVRHAQEITNAKLEALTMDVRKVQGDVEELKGYKEEWEFIRNVRMLAKGQQHSA